jgi:anti-sigma factor RsiW
MSQSNTPPQSQRVGGLWCHEVLERLTRYLDDDLNDEERAAVKAHVAVCDACARFGGAFAKAIAQLRLHDDVDGVDGVDDVTTEEEHAFRARILAAIDAPTD